MEWDGIAKNWKRVGPLAQAHPLWNLTEDEVKQVNGDRKRLDALLAQKLGITEQEARNQTQEWSLRVEADPSDVKEAKVAAKDQKATAPGHQAGTGHS